MTRRPKPQVITLTEAAVARVRELMEGAGGEAVGLRIGIKNAGCAGMAYKLDVAREIPAGDEVVELNGVRIFIDPSAVLFILGTVMDYEVTKLSASFTFKNPNQVDACGCGESVKLQPAEIPAQAPAQA